MMLLLFMLSTFYGVLSMCRHHAKSSHALADIVLVTHLKGWYFLSKFDG